MVDQALHEHEPAHAAEDHSLTGSATNPKPNVRKILDTTRSLSLKTAFTIHLIKVVQINLETDRVTNRVKHEIAKEPSFKLNERLGISTETLHEFSQNQIHLQSLGVFCINLLSLT